MNQERDVLQSIVDFDLQGRIGLLNGLSGKALFYHELFRFSNEEVHYNNLMKILEELFDNMNQGMYKPAFFDGLSGIAWLIEFISKNDVVELDTNNFFDVEVDEFLRSQMIAFMRDGNYDFFHGGLGICYYFLVRYKNTDHKEDQERYERYIREFLIFLEQISVQQEEMVHWEMRNYPLYQSEKNGFFLSHKECMSSVLLILAQLHEESSFSPFVEWLLKSSSAYLWKKYRFDEEHLTIDEAWALYKSSKALGETKNVQVIEQIFLSDYFDQFVEIKEDAYASAYLCMIYQHLSDQGQRADSDLLKMKWYQGFHSLYYQRKNLFTHDQLWDGYFLLGLASLSIKYHQNMSWSQCLLIS